MEPIKIAEEFIKDKDYKNVKYLLIIIGKETKFVSHSMQRMEDLLHSYNILGDLDEFKKKPMEIIKAELWEDNQEGYIFEIKNGKPVEIARYLRKVDNN